MISDWTSDDIPSQRGRTIVVTGTGGLGFEDALALARAGAEVIIAGRNPMKGADAIARIRQAVPGAAVSFEPVDLGHLASIADFARRMDDAHHSVDVLINNAGVMTPPQRQTTRDGFELQFGTNYLGHFALTAHLLPLLLRGKEPRVVTVSSVAARSGTINFDDLQAERGYRPMPVYSQSKLACLMFAIELQRRSDAAGWGIASISAHPGISRTDLLHNAPGRSSPQGIARSLLWFLFQPVAQGALPTLFAATSPDARKGGYYGPDRLGETRGYPAMAKVPKAALDAAAAARLWEVSERLAGVTFRAPASRPLLIEHEPALVYGGR
jgi:NAD(P)-dependent dehydrogenase (short-subunit alcohol dehydrogenase family)